MSAQLALSFDRRRPQVPYYPTTPMPRDQLADAMRIAEQQDEAVLAIYRSHHLVALTPSQVHGIGLNHGRAWLLTSTRRSITNLTTAGVLTRLNGTRMGPYGRPESLWILTEKRS